ncbi:TPA: type 1 fimbrial protein [Klebsiella aerogenes]|nr:type 1 fimbrial protein [Klebsiella aerogenes]
MKNVRKSLLALAVVSLAVGVIPAQAQNKLHFSGQVVNRSCQVAGRNGNTEVDLGQVELSGLEGQGRSGAGRPFSIHLEGCPAAQDISISFSGSRLQAGANGAYMLLPFAGKGSASGMGIEVAQQGTNVTGNGLLSFDQLTGTSAEQADAKGEVLFNFMAWVRPDTTHSLRAGKIRAAADINIRYL